MSRLSKGVYGHCDESLVGPFGLQSGQKRKPFFVQKCGWYNRHGQELGHGDLSADDLVRISRELYDDELFLVVSETNSSAWSGGRFTDLFSVRLDLEQPGIYYLAQKCFLIIAKNKLYFVDRYGLIKDKIDTYERDGLRFTPITSAQVTKVIHPLPTFSSG